jgi:hypothetical protein
MAWIYIGALFLAFLGFSALCGVAISWGSKRLARRDIIRRLELIKSESRVLQQVGQREYARRS